ncbi:hypothetical protein FJ986_23430 [Mesorhizobium sp. B1-1-1]|uniref:hypothetical protein n=1 Tax=Mesorhizobium sp. B1-1-1 TaxID=2589983 RepID=UPI00112EC562|nr:hypothetical protein [Mesorhizobium sp. B1-1-1]TPN63603.1 hypothetical protein FJ986_23430 [Mesorhizobium sp. B1-1-1]
MNALPQWTELAEKRGLDPLGMQNSGVALYQSLVPGISNVTLRMRYYGFYCWLSDAYARHEGSTDFDDWQRWVRRAEALYALVSSAQGGETGVGGIDWANNRLLRGEAEIDFIEAASTDPNVNRYLRQSMGVFGGAYYSQMVETGLFIGGDHGIPKATAARGINAAGAFRDAIGPQVEALLIAKIRSARVTREELSLLGSIAPSRIQEDSPEREIYEQVLFPAGDSVTVSGQSRHSTLLLLLGAADALGSRPDPDDIRWFLFHSADLDLPEALERQRLRWEAYQSHDLFQLAAAGLLGWAIALVSEVEGGLELGEIGAEVEFRLRSSDSVIADRTWSEFRGDLRAEDDDYQNWSDTLSAKRHSAEDKVWEALRLIAALHGRIHRRPELAAEIAQSFPLDGHARSIRTELAWFDKQEGRPVAELVSDYLVRRIVRRHSWVAMQKFRRQKDYTFLFEARDGRIAHRSDYLPVATTPRLAPAVQFLADIHLVGPDGPTIRGQELLGLNP